MREVKNAAPGFWRAERLKTIGLWCALLAVSMALIGGGVLVWRSLQADQALSLVARSAMSTAPIAGLAPPATVTPAAQPVAAAPSGSGVPAATVSKSAVAKAAAPGPGPGPGPVAAATLDGRRWSGAAPKARARLPQVKGGGKTAQQVKRGASVRAKALARTRLATEARAAKRRPAVATVQQRLALCKARAGEAAAACYARACRSYARKASVCLNGKRRR